jgi:hypothetical protein
MEGVNGAGSTGISGSGSFIQPANRMEIIIIVSAGLFLLEVKSCLGIIIKLEGMNELVEGKIMAQWNKQHPIPDSGDTLFAG